MRGVGRSLFGGASLERRGAAYLFAVAVAVLQGMTLWAAPPAEDTASARGPRVTFREVPPSESGITWVHENAMSEERHLPETVGAGCAFFDYDNDGWMDIYLVNSGPADFYKPQDELRNALYRNNRDGTFTDVTAKAGVEGREFGMGVAAADYDGDGDTDLYVTNYGRNLLYQNRGDGTFEEVAESAGLDVSGWFTHAVWFDSDNDSDLDLFVSSFVSYSLGEAKYCGDNSIGRRHYCIPRSFKPMPSRLFRNEGTGKFTDVSAESGIASVEGKAFGAVATDINNDGLLDLFVANDTVANFLFVNQGDGAFEEEGLLYGVAYSDAGNARSGMGVDAADYDGDGWQDLFVANIDQEMFSLYRNLGGADFQDASLEVRRETRLLSGWGLKFFDYDNDGDPDLILSNGHPDDMINIFKPLVTYKEPLVLFENLGEDYKNVSARSGSVFKKKFASRGLAAGDYDNDGDLDILVSNNGEAPLLLENTGGNANHWIGLWLQATHSNPDAVGAIITWEAGGRKRRRLKAGGGSYLSSHDPREILGIGTALSVDAVRIEWPSGQVDELTDVSIDKYSVVVEGKGITE